MTEKMCGVVLWADQCDQKAVIWCEDHGDLAYYHDKDANSHDGLSLDAGDLIQFELFQEHDLRLVRNPTRLVQRQFVGLAQDLRSSAGNGQELGQERASFPPARPSHVTGRRASNVVPFPCHHMRLDTLKVSC